MAVQKLNTSKITRKDALAAKETLSAKNTITTKDALTAKDTLSAKDALTVKGNKGSISLNPRIDVSEIRLGSIDKNFLNLSVINGAPLLEFNLAGMSSKNVRQWFDELDIRTRNLDASIRLKEKAFDRILEDRNFLNPSIDLASTSAGFKVSINPNKGIDCIYSMGLKECVVYTYKLERAVVGKKIAGIIGKEIWNVLIPERTKTFSAFSGLCYHDSNVQEGVTYKYRLTLVDSKSNAPKDPIVREILYKKLDIAVRYFSATPDSIEKKVHFSYKIDNCVSFKITRVNDGKDYTSCQDDTDVYAGGIYKYVLVPSNAWGEGDKAYATANCTNVLPKVGKISIKKEAIEKGVTLKWAIATASKNEIIQRRLKGVISWTNLREQSTKKATSLTKEDSYKDVDSSLKLGADYEYCIRCHNDWGDADSPIAEVNMSNAVAQKPRMLLSDQLTKLKWVAANNVEKYDIVRFSDSALSKLKNPDSGFNEQLSGSRSSFIDSKLNMKKNVLYTYRIIAHNGWGDSDPCYYDIIDRDDFKEKRESDPNEICYHYKEQNKTKANYALNFQGVATDGRWWYFVNGVPSYKIWGVKYTSTVYLRKRAVDKTLDKDVDYDYKFPKGAHAGDLECFGNYLFVPVYKESENDRAEIWIFDKNLKETKRITTDVLYKNDGNPLNNIGWCAINHSDQRLYTSSSYVYGEIYSYKIEFENLSRIENGEKGLKIFTEPRVVRLLGSNGEPYTKEAVQGGCFDYYNNLYLNSGFGSGKVNEGIHVFRLIHDELQNALNRANNDNGKADIYEKYRSGNWLSPCVFSSAKLLVKSSQGGVFKYQFDSSDDEEPEGLTYYDFFHAYDKDRLPYDKEVMDGSFHASLLLNSGSAPHESMCLKHYEHFFRYTQERNIYYSKSNLSIVGNEVLDNVTLVKKFEGTGFDDVFAKKTMDVLNELDCCKIFTFGLLDVCCPYYDFDYMFSVGVNDNGFVGNHDQKIYTYDPKQFDNVKADTFYSGERYEIRIALEKKQKDDLESCHFYAHNKEDTVRIIELLKQYSRLCCIGVGPDNDWTHRFKAKNNFIWLEGKVNQ